MLEDKPPDQVGCYCSLPATQFRGSAWTPACRKRRASTTRPAYRLKLVAHSVYVKTYAFFLECWKTSRLIKSAAAAPAALPPICNTVFDTSIAPQTPHDTHLPCNTRVTAKVVWFVSFLKDSRRTRLALHPPCATPALRYTRPALHPPCATPVLRYTRLALPPPCATPALHYTRLAPHPEPNDEAQGGKYEHDH